MNAPAAVRQFLKTVLQQVCHFKIDVIAGDANATAYKHYKRQEYQDLHNSCCHHVERCNVRSIRDAHLKASFTSIIKPIIILLSFTQEEILTVVLWLFSHGKASWIQIMRQLWSNSRKQTQRKREETNGRQLVHQKN